MSDRRKGWAEGPQYTQYWDNVSKVERMVEEETIAYWRARAIGLQWENKQLHAMVRHLLGIHNYIPTEPTAQVRISS